MFGRNMQAQVERRPGHCSVRSLERSRSPGQPLWPFLQTLPVSWEARVTNSASPPECWSHTNLDTSGLWASVSTACTEQFLGSGGRCPLELAVNSVKARTQLRQMLWTGGPAVCGQKCRDSQALLRLSGSLC